MKNKIKPWQYFLVGFISTLAAVGIFVLWYYTNIYITIIVIIIIVIVLKGTRGLIIPRT